MTKMTHSWAAQISLSRSRLQKAEETLNDLKNSNVTEYLKAFERGFSFIYDVELAETHLQELIDWAKVNYDKALAEFESLGTLGDER